ncbi:c-type heme family protein [Neorhodopirellula pilleata]|nr:DUF3365 domain-containing protein [Neorhodopirellula pilleata]
MSNTTTKSIKLSLLFACFLSMVGCSSKEKFDPVVASGEEREATIVPGQSPSEEAKAELLAAKEALFTRLSGRLMEAIANRGPAAAIAVCQQEAPTIAKEVGAEQGLQIGRVGVRLRNPNNVAPSWAAELVRDKTELPMFVTLDNGHAAALLPIKLQTQCLMCHGPNDQIPQMIQEQLTRQYPNDQATGFQEGELRGWFWIDSPNT